MRTIETKIAKNGTRLYYVNGKRAGRNIALEAAADNREDNTFTVKYEYKWDEYYVAGAIQSSVVTYDEVVKKLVLSIDEYHGFSVILDGVEIKSFCNKDQAKALVYQIEDAFIAGYAGIKIALDGSVNILSREQIDLGILNDQYTLACQFVQAYVKKGLTQAQAEKLFVTAQADNLDYKAISDLAAQFKNETVEADVNDYAVTTAAMDVAVNAEQRNADINAGNYCIIINNELVTFKNHSIDSINANRKFGLEYRKNTSCKTFYRYNRRIAAYKIAELYMNEERAAEQGKFFHEFFDQYLKTYGDIQVVVALTYVDGREHFFAAEFNQSRLADRFIADVKALAGDTPCEISTKYTGNRNKPAWQDPHKYESTGNLEYVRSAQQLNDAELDNAADIVNVDLEKIEAGEFDSEELKACEDDGYNYIYTTVTPKMHCVYDKPARHLEIAIGELRKLLSTTDRVWAIKDIKGNLIAKGKNYAQLEDFAESAINNAETDNLPAQDIFSDLPADPNEDNYHMAHFITAAEARQLGKTSYSIRSTDYLRAKKALTALQDALADKSDEYVFSISIYPNALLDLDDIVPVYSNGAEIYHVIETDGSEDDSDNDNPFDLLPNLDELNDVDITADTNIQAKIDALTEQLNSYDTELEALSNIDENLYKAKRRCMNERDRHSEHDSNHAFYKKQNEILREAMKAFEERNAYIKEQRDKIIMQIRKLKAVDAANNAHYEISNTNPHREVYATKTRAREKIG